MILFKLCKPDICITSILPILIITDNPPYVSVLQGCSNANKKADNGCLLFYFYMKIFCTSSI